MQSNIRTIINYSTWDRKENFEFFKSFTNPQYSITAEVDCTKAYNNRKNVPFFLKYLYAILRAANEITELRYRVETIDCVDNSNTNYNSAKDVLIVLYKAVSVITPIKVGDNGKFHSIEVPYNKDFEKFCASYNKVKNSIDINNTNPYNIENRHSEDSACFNDHILVSTVKDINYTSMTFTQSNEYGSKKPIINVGKAVERLEPIRNGEQVSFTVRMKMPIAICVHHGLCDGYHLSIFYNKVQEYLDC